MMNPMRILVRLVLNWGFLEIISRCCATLSAIGCNVFCGDEFCGKQNLLATILRLYCLSHSSLSHLCGSVYIWSLLYGSFAKESIAFHILLSLVSAVRCIYGLFYMALLQKRVLPFKIVSFVGAEWYSLLRLDCHLVSISNLNLLGLFSTECGKRDLEN